MSRTLLLLASCLTLALLAGCGNKGPLVQPTHPAAPSSTTAPVAAVPLDTPR